MALSATEISILISAQDQASSVLKHVEDQGTSLGNTFSKITQNALGFAGGLAAIAGIGSAFDALGGVVVGFNSKIEQSTISWTTFTGNAEAAAAVLQQVQQIAATTPFEFNDVDQAAKRFVNAGFSAQQALNFVIPLSNAVASVGLGAQGVDRVSLALAQMTAKGKVSGEEMLQLAEAQIPAWQILADATGKPIPELQKLVTAGKISAKEFTDAFGVFYGSTGKFADAAHAQSLTLQGSLSTIRDELNIVGSTAFQPLFKALSDAARAFAAFVQSDQFTVWGAKIQAVVGFIVDGLGGLAGAFYGTLSGVLDVVNTVGQAIYQGLQWLNPFAAHSAPLVSQVADGVAAIQSEYESLGGLTATFSGIGAAFEDLGTRTANFSDSVDGLSIKTEKALAVMGPGVTAAFHEASDAVLTAKASLGDIKQAWDDASDALVPLKDNLGATKDALKDQQSTLSDLKFALSDAKAAFDPLNDALKAAQQNAKDAEAAIKSLTQAPIQGTAEFEQKISDANIALKQQSLALLNVKQSNAYETLGNQIDSASAKLKEAQRVQATFIPNLPTNATDAQKKAHAEAVEQNRVIADQQRNAIAQQQVGLDALKAKQAELLDPVQKQLDKQRQNLDAINLEKDATIGVSQERIRSAAANALGIKEQSEAQIKAAITAAGAQKQVADAQVDKLTPQVATQQAAIDGLTAKILDQQHAVDAAQKTTDTANKTYSDAKEKVDDLGAAYRDTKAQVSSYEQQLRSTIQAGDTQVQKIKAAAAEAKRAAAGAAGTAGPKVDVLEGLDIEGSKKKIKEFQDNVETMRASIENAFSPIGAAFKTVGDVFNSMVDVFRAGQGVLGRLGVDFSGLAALIGPLKTGISLFVVVFGGLVLGLKAWSAANALVAPTLQALSPAISLLRTGLLLLTGPLGVVALAVTALAVAFSQDLGGIRTAVTSALAPLLPIFTAMGAAVEKLFQGDFKGAFRDFLDALHDLGPAISTAVGTLAKNLLDFVAGTTPKLAGQLATWGTAFTSWIGPRIGPFLTELGRIIRALLSWIGDRIPDIIVKVKEWGLAFVGWVGEHIQPMLDDLGALKDRLLAWVIEQKETLTDKLKEWGTTFVGWVGGNVQPMLDELGALKDRLLAWVGEQKDKLLAKLGEWGSALSKWVSDNVQPMLDELGKLKDRLLKWLGEQKDSILGKLGEWGGAFKDWVGGHIDPMLGELGKLKDRLIAWIGEQAGPLGDKLGEWKDKFLTWANIKKEELSSKLGEVVENVKQWIGEHAPEIGDKLGEWKDKFLGWASIKKEELSAKLDTVVENIKQWIGENTGPIGDKLGEWKDKFLEWANIKKEELSTKLDTVAATVKQWITDNGPTILERGKEIGGKLVDGIVSGLELLKDKVGPALRKGLAEAFGPDAATGADAFGSTLSTTMDTLSKNIQNTVDWLGKFKTALDQNGAAKDLGDTWNSLASAAQIVWSWLGPLAAGFLRVFDDVDKLLKPTQDVNAALAGEPSSTDNSALLAARGLKEVATWLKETADNVDRFVKFLDSVGKALDNMARASTNAGNAVRRFFDSIGEAEDRAAGAILKFVLSLPARLGEVATLLFPQGAATVQGFLDGMGSKFDQLGTFVQTKIVDPLITSVKKALGIASPSTVFSAIGVEVIDGFLGGLTTRWTDITTWVTDTFGPDGTLVRAIPDAGKLLVDTGSSILMSLKDGLDAGWTDAQGVYAWLVALPDQIVATLATMKPAETLVSIGTDLLGGLKAGLDTAWTAANGLFTWLSDLLNQIFTAIQASKPLETLVSVGTSLMAGLLSGITSGWEDIKTWFLNLKWPDMPSFPSISMPSMPGSDGGAGGARAGGTVSPANLASDAGGVISANRGGLAAFKESFAPYAKYAADQLKIDPSIVTSMAISESGGGNVPGNSFFGMKGSPLATGSTSQDTWELVNGQRVNQKASFATFPDPKTAIDAWVQFIQKNDPGAIGANTPEQFAQGLKQGGYMTDTAAHYGATLRSLGAIAAAASAPQIEDMATNAASNLDLPDSGPQNFMHGAMIPASGALKDGARDAQAFATQFNQSMTSVILDAQKFAEQTGISIDSANKIMMDHGTVARDVFGIQLPAAVDLSDEAVQKFSDMLGINWDEGRAALEAGGAVADAVMGTQIPAAAQTTVDAIAKVGDKDLWDFITSNAAIAGQDIKKYLQDTGAPAIDVATASLEALKKASGLSLPQIQGQAAAAGKDIKTWLQDTGVPAAKALAKSFGDLGVAAGDPLTKPLAALKELAATLGNEGLAVAAKDALLLEGQFPGLTSAVQAWIATLGNIPTSIKTEIETIFKTTGVPAAGTPAAIAASAAGSATPSKSQGDVAAPDNFQGSSQAAQSARADYRAAHPDAIVSSDSKGNVIITHRAAGGPVHPGRSYLVGEQGPELITPGLSGIVHTASATAGIASALSSQIDPARVSRLVSMTDSVQGFARALMSIPSAVEVTLTTNATGTVQTVLRALGDIPDSVYVPVAVGTGQSMGLIRSLRDGLATLPRAVDVALSADTGPAATVVQTFARMLRTVPRALRTSLAVDGNTSSIQSWIRQLADVPSSTLTTLEADGTQAGLQVGVLKTVLGTVPDAVHVTLDATANLSAIRTLSNQLAAIPQTVSVAINTAADTDAIQQTQTAIMRLPKKTIVTIGADAVGITASVSEATSQVSRLARGVQVPVTVDVGPSARAVNAIQRVLNTVPSTVRVVLAALADFAPIQNWVTQLNDLPRAIPVAIVTSVNIGAVKSTVATLAALPHTTTVTIDAIAPAVSTTVGAVMTQIRRVPDSVMVPVSVNTGQSIDTLSRLRDWVLAIPQSVPVVVDVDSVGVVRLASDLKTVPTSVAVAVTANSTPAITAVQAFRSTLRAVPALVRVGLAAVGNMAPVQAWTKQLGAIPRLVPVSITATADTTAVGATLRQVDLLPAQVHVPITVDAGESLDTVRHLRDTFKAIPPTMTTLLNVDANAGIRSVNQLSAGLRAVPSPRQVAGSANSLVPSRTVIALTDRALAGSAPVRPSVSLSAGSLVARPAQAGPVTTSGRISRQDARMIAEELAKAMESAPAPRVHVEELRSALIRIGNRNGGTVGLG